MTSEKEPKADLFATVTNKYMNENNKKITFLST